MVLYLRHEKKLPTQGLSQQGFNNKTTGEDNNLRKRITNRIIFS